MASSAKQKETVESSAANHTISQVLGEITWLLSQTPIYKDIKISALEHTIMPALLLKQFRIFYDDNKHPVGFAVWAYLSDDVSKKIKASMEAGKSMQLDMKEWKSGDKPWIMEMVTPYAGANPKLPEMMLTQLGDTTFKGKEFHYFLTNLKTGARDLATMDPGKMGHA